MPIPIVGIAPLNGWRQVGAPHWIVMGQHRFEATRDHQLAHYTDDVLRAVVPPEGWAEYVKLWPDAQLLLDQLGRAHAERQAAQAQAREQTKGSELDRMNAVQLQALADELAQRAAAARQATAAG